MKIHLLNCGSCEPLCARLFERSGSIFARGHLTFHCLLVETDDGLVLVDTGLGEANLKNLGRSYNWLLRVLFKPVLDPAVTAKAQIIAMGLNPDDVSHIIMTHMDHDHAGGLADFPNAKVHLARAEHVSMSRRRTILEKLRYGPRQIAHQPRFVMQEPAGVRWKGLSELRVTNPANELPQGIKLLSLHGHSRGHCGVAIQLSHDEPWVLHVGDAVLHHGELAGRPYCPIGLRLMRTLTRSHKSQWKTSLASVRRLAQEGKVKIICTHDPAMALDSDPRKGSR